MAGQTIDEVIAELDGIVAQCHRDRSQLGYFAALYREVTREVRDGIRQGRFEDGPRMERLDVIFANRYLDAYATFRGGGSPTQSWELAFGYEHNPRLLVLQHLLLGMNAHINLDLGIAAAQCCPGEALPALRRDFEEINQLLGSMTDGIQKRLTTVSGAMWLIDDMFDVTDKLIARLQIRRARDRAWRLAEQLAPLPPHAHAPLIDARDRWATRRGWFVAQPLGLRPLLQFVATVEPKDPVKVIECLS